MADFKNKAVVNLMIQLIVVAIVAYLVASSLKLLFGIPRPCELLETCQESFSFPSRHTTMVFAAATLISFYISNKYLKIIAFVLSFIVGYWRVASGLHTLQDVVGGAVIGVVIGFLMYRIFKSYLSRNRRHR